MIKRIFTTIKNNFDNITLPQAIIISTIILVIGLLLVEDKKKSIYINSDVDLYEKDPDIFNLF